MRTRILAVGATVVLGATCPPAHAAPLTLDQLLAAQADPASPLFRQFLTPETFSARFGSVEPKITSSTKIGSMHAHDVPTFTARSLSQPEFTQAYGLDTTGHRGAGVTVAVIAFDGWQQSDIDQFDKQNSLNAQGKVTTVSVDGKNYDDNPGANQLETSLDIELVRSVVPDANILVYEAPNSDKGAVDAYKQIVSDNKADVVSISWGACELETTKEVLDGIDNAVKQGLAQGMTYVAASGDDGAKDCARSSNSDLQDKTAVDFPGSSPNITAVGGTTLYVDDHGRWGQETAWASSGGGYSTKFAKPSWQPGTNAHRSIPDVAANADANTGYQIISSGATTPVGGTSGAAPLWAGFLAAQKGIDGTRLGNVNPLIYKIGQGASYGDSFHDITVGKNDLYASSVGYDQVTGWGSPRALGLSTALGAFSKKS